MADVAHWNLARWDLARWIARQPARGWLLTGALAVLMVAVDQGIDHRWLGNDILNKPPWSVLVVFAAMLLVNGRQEAVLVALFLGMEISEDLAMRPGLNGATHIAVLIRRGFAMACCIWVAQLRSQLARRNQALANSRTRIRGQLERSLQASALAHELRQPLSHLLLQTRLLQHGLERGSRAGTGRAARAAAGERQPDRRADQGDEPAAARRAQPTGQR